MIVTTSINGGGGGGVKVNVTVNAYETLPVSGSENEIAVITTTPVTDWIVKAEQPTGVEGLVWIEVGGESDVPFYGDKKDTVKLYPKSVKQYINGAWANRDASIYQGGAWTQFSRSIIILYERGSVGSVQDWTSYKTINSSSYGSLTEGSSGIHVKVYDNNTTSQVGHHAYLTEKVDLTEADTLTIRVRGGSVAWGEGNGGIWLTVSSGTITAITSSSPSGAKAATRITDVTNNLTYDLDVSSLSGSYYVGVYLCVKDSSSTAVGYELKYDQLIMR